MMRLVVPTPVGVNRNLSKTWGWNPCVVPTPVGVNRADFMQMLTLAELSPRLWG